MRKYLLSICILWSVALWPQTDSPNCDTLPQRRPWPENIVARLDSLMQEPLLTKTQLGLMVYDLTADSTLYRQGYRQTLRPASTMKLLTAITAIDRLGSDYVFRTDLYYRGELKDSTLSGDLYLVGGMDPAFDKDDLRMCVERICQLGIDTIRGHIVTDLSMKDDTRLGEGWCWDDDNPVLTPLLVDRKDEFTERLLTGLRNRGITVEATIAEGTVPTSAVRVASRFHTMKDILTRMLKDSDNLYAEAMLYQIGAAGGQRRATAKHAQQHERRLISRLGLNPGEYKLADGSGLSLYNYVTPELMVRLLRFAYQDQKIFHSLYPALPIAGEDGTLKDRMKKTAASGNVRAKTGTLTGISSLAGYCMAANGHLLAFCIINQGVMRTASGKAFQDKVCTALCQD